MITGFFWTGGLTYKRELYDIRVVRALYTTRAKPPLANDPKTRVYNLVAKDRAGVQRTLAQITTDGPLNDEDRTRVIAMAPYHPTMERVE